MNLIGMVFVAFYQKKVYSPIKWYFLIGEPCESVLQHIDIGSILFHGHEFGIVEWFDSVFDERIFINCRIICDVLV